MHTLKIAPVFTSASLQQVGPLVSSQNEWNLSAFHSLLVEINAIEHLIIPKDY